MVTLGSKLGHQVAPLASPHCLGLPYWYYQLLLSLYLHQWSLQKGGFSQWETTGPIDRTPGTPGFDKNGFNHQKLEYDHPETSETPRILWGTEPTKSVYGLRPLCRKWSKLQIILKNLLRRGSQDQALIKFWICQNWLGSSFFWGKKIGKSDQIHRQILRNDFTICWTLSVAARDWRVSLFDFG